MYRGVRLDKTKSCRPWRAQISVASRFKHLGYFDTAEEAARAYDTAARHYFKDDAVVNYFEDGTRNYLAAGKRRQLDFVSTSASPGSTSTASQKAKSSASSVTTATTKSAQSTSTLSTTTTQASSPSDSGKTDKKDEPPKVKSSSMYRGVYHDRRRGSKPFYAMIGAEGKSKYLGYFGTEEEAARAYDRAARDYHRERAITNFNLDGTFNKDAKGAIQQRKPRNSLGSTSSFASPSLWAHARSSKPSAKKKSHGGDGDDSTIMTITSEEGDDGDGDGGKQDDEDSLGSLSDEDEDEEDLVLEEEEEEVEEGNEEEKRKEPVDGHEEPPEDEENGEEAEDDEEEEPSTKRIHLTPSPAAPASLPPPYHPALPPPHLKQERPRSPPAAAGKMTPGGPPSSHSHTSCCPDTSSRTVMWYKTETGPPHWRSLVMQLLWQEGQRFPERDPQRLDIQNALVAISKEVPEVDSLLIHLFGKGGSHLPYATKGAERTALVKDVVRLVAERLEPFDSEDEGWLGPQKPARRRASSPQTYCR